MTFVYCLSTATMPIYTARNSSLKPCLASSRSNFGMPLCDQSWPSIWSSLADQSIREGSPNGYFERVHNLDAADPPWMSRACTNCQEPSIVKIEQGRQSIIRSPDPSCGVVANTLRMEIAQKKICLQPPLAARTRWRFAGHFSPQNSRF